jgi:hypothetical protein
VPLVKKANCASLARTLYLARRVLAVRSGPVPFELREDSIFRFKKRNSVSSRYGWRNVSDAPLLAQANWVRTDRPSVDRFGRRVPGDLS